MYLNDSMNSFYFVANTQIVLDIVIVHVCSQGATLSMIHVVMCDEKGHPTEEVKL